MAMASLQMIRGDVNVSELHRWMGQRRLVDTDYAMHCLLVESFGTGLAPKPFRLLLPRAGGLGTLYGYASGDAGSLRQASGMFACPLQSRIIPANSLDDKPMPSEWRLGRQLGFEVRVRPVVRRSRNAQWRPGKECDVFLLEASRHARGEMPNSREAVYIDWLTRQFEVRRGARLVSNRTRMVSFQRSRAVLRPGRRHTEGPDAVMRGVLTITDAAAFSSFLARGIGRHRAYGYGMLLLRPA